MTSRSNADKIVSLPSFSCSLSSLPQATSMDNVSLHPTQYANRAAESEAKLKKALSKTASSFPAQKPPMAAYQNMPSQNAHPSSSPLMMRQKQKLQS